MGSIPTAYKFNPTDQEIIQDFLSKKINGQPLPLDHPVIDEELYQTNPAQIFRRFPHRNIVYIFTPLKRKGSRINRTDKMGGTWKGQDRGQAIRDAQGSVVGIKKSFKYQTRRPYGPQWIMKEYSLDGQHATNQDYAFCRIKAKKSANVAEEGNSQHQENSFLLPSATNNLQQQENVIDPIASDSASHLQQQHGSDAFDLAGIDWTRIECVSPSQLFMECEQQGDALRNDDEDSLPVMFGPEFWNS